MSMLERTPAGRVAALAAWALSAGALGCSEPTFDRDGDVAALAQSLDACGESVPSDRNVDGIPAYAQCDAAENGAIFSNDGVSTSTTSLGADWVRTQYSGGYQCTELAGRYLQFKWDVSWRPNGNAGMWCESTPPANSGMVQNTTPVHGDLMVLAPGSCGADGTTGHVTVVDVVDAAAGRLTVVEQNRARRGTYEQSCAKCFLHVVANDGTNPGNPIESTAGVAPPAAAGSTGAAGATAGSGAGRGAPTSSRPGRPSSGGSAAPPPPSAAAPTPAAPAGAPAAAASAAAGTSSMDTAGAAGSSQPDRSTRVPEQAGCSVSAAGGAQGIPHIPTGLSLLGFAWAFARSRRRDKDPQRRLCR